jgi:hypothetical protein
MSFFESIDAFSCHQTSRRDIESFRNIRKARVTSRQGAERGEWSIDPVSRSHIMKRTQRKNYPTHLSTQLPSDILCLFGRSHEFIQNGCANSCQCITTHIVIQAFCPPSCVICTHLGTEEVQRNADVPVPETRAKTIHAGNLCIHSE